MQLRKWNELPKFMRTREVRKYYNIVNKRRASLMVKRLFDIVVASIMLAMISCTQYRLIMDTDIWN